MSEATMTQPTSLSLQPHFRGRCCTTTYNLRTLMSVVYMYQLALVIVGQLPLEG